MSTPHHCDVCRSGYECRTLKTLLTVVAKHEDELPQGEARDRFRELKARLAAYDWSYPAGDAQCVLSGQPEEVRRMTSELVDLWRANVVHAEEPASLFQMEVTAD